MRALVLDGSRSLSDLTGARALSAVGHTLAALGVDVKVRHLREEKLGYCQGEFDCWVKTPGVCRLADAGRGIAEAASSVDLLLLVGPSAFGGLGSELKNPVDRLLPNITPFFEQRSGLTHHTGRYDRYPALAAIGWAPKRVLGDAETPGDAAWLFPRIVAANAVNFLAPRWGSVLFASDDDTRAPRTRIERLLHELTMLPDDAALLEGEAGAEPSTLELLLRLARPGAAESRAPRRPPARVAVLVGSAKPKGTSTSESLARALVARFPPSRVEMVYATSFAHPGPVQDDATRALLEADLVVLASPVYVDALPSLVVRALEKVAAGAAAAPRARRLVAIVNSGFPEPEQCALAIGVARAFGRQGGFGWAGALALGGGEAVAGRPVEELGGLGLRLAPLDRASEALALGNALDALDIEALATPLVPAWLYRQVGGLGWRARAAKNLVPLGALSAPPRRPLPPHPAR